MVTKINTHTHTLFLSVCVCDLCYMIYAFSDTRHLGRGEKETQQRKEQRDKERERGAREGRGGANK